MLRFVVALEPEARPLIERYRLRRDADAHPFAVYRGDGVALVVSGIGKIAAAAATSYLHLAAGGGRNAAWLNVGIAGHRHRGVGEAIVGHKIRDAASGRCWYPPRLVAAALPRPRAADGRGVGAGAPLPGREWRVGGRGDGGEGIPSDEIVTVDVPETAFAEPAAYEMEAAGFYDTACRFASSEVVQCLKIVSDGPGDPAGALTAQRVAELVDSRLDDVERLAAACLEMAADLRRLEADPPDFDRCLERWAFTVTDKRRLARLLRRRQTLAPDEPLPLGDLRDQARGKDVNRRLAQWLDAVAIEGEVA